MDGVVDLLACPICRGDLHDADDSLVCAGCGRRYPSRAGVPVLFTDASHHAAGETGSLQRLYHALLAHPRVYDRAQKYGGGRPIRDQVARVLHDVGGMSVLDVGAGTGMVGTVVPADTAYIWLDNDPLKLSGLLRSGIAAAPVLGDVVKLPFREKSVDVVTMVEVSHHLSDEALDASLAEVARVTRDRFVLVDGLRSTRLRSRALWALDLGRHPRTAPELRAALGERFIVEREVPFRVNHDHVIFVASPR